MNRIQLQLIIVGVVLTLVTGYVRFNTYKTNQLKQALSVSNQAYEAQLSENEKASTVFNSVLNANFEKQSAIIDKLDKKLAFESKRADVAEKLAQQALTDRDDIQTKYTTDLKELTGLLNEKTHACVTTDMPPNYVDWVHQLSAQSRIQR